ncbi:hypothetical protein QFC21_006478 [Naganishia friedmannii]|uniref:Uncharacterized protein n=1 Tax=Naganishia friedmannii TaxID=89922 RepID=A0ACC2V2E2_9TREE|nr:hypothetical protein QFC21_006478 [Naganishia friedmannii]
MSPSILSDTNKDDVDVLPSKRYSVHDQVWDRQYGIWTKAPEPPKALTGGQEAFVAFRRKSANTNNADPFTHIELQDQRLVQFLRKVLPTESGLFSKPASIDAQLLYVSRNRVKEASIGQDISQDLLTTIETLLSFVAEEFADVEEKLQVLPQGTIAWSLLWLLFEVGQHVEIVYDLTGEKMAMQVEGWAYAMSQKGRTFNLHGHVFQWTGVRIQKIKVTRKVLEFSHCSQIYCSYKGSFVMKAHSGGVRINGQGRAMIDVRQFRRSVPVMDVWDDDVNTNDAEIIDLGDDSDWNAATKAHLLPPTLHGFSFVHKKWGEFSVDKLQPVVWADAPFRHLVLSDAYREVVRSLVEVHSSDKKDLLLTDVVQGKSSGCIIALYGNPGCGKTLTAEAVSEHLRRPLYSVSAGELGTSVSALEQNLKSVLDADVFLEKRDSRELERNGLVSIFLRVLEYFSGILILTTNRLESFDNAFLSRFSLILKYPDLDAPSRRVLWDRFLIMANSDPSAFNLDALAAIELNGRAIKQTVRTAQALALTRGVALGTDHIDTVLSMNVE